MREARRDDDREALQADWHARQPVDAELRVLVQRQAPQCTEPREALVAKGPQAIGLRGANVVQLLEGLAGGLQHGLRTIAG